MLRKRSKVVDKSTDMEVLRKNSAVRQVILLNLMIFIRQFLLKNYQVSTSDLRLNYMDFDSNLVGSSGVIPAMEFAQSVVDGCLSDYILIQMIETLRGAESTDEGYGELCNRAVNMIADYAAIIVKLYNEDREIRSFERSFVQVEKAFDGKLIDESDREIRENRIDYLIKVADAYSSLPH